MSKKYLVIAKVDGQVRMFSMRSNGPENGIKELTREMVAQLSGQHRIDDLSVTPWPAEGLAPVPVGNSCAA